MEPGIEMSRSLWEHTYQSSSIYTVTVSSSEKDYTKEQMPEWDNTDQTEELNPILTNLIKVHTPLLSMDSTSLISTFNNLPIREIPENVFYYNPKTDYFSVTFLNCVELASIPEKLFANTPNATYFFAAFTSFPSLT